MSTATPRVPSAGDRLRELADARAEYVHNPEDPHDPIAREVATARQLARILDGDLMSEASWRPSWLWTDEISRALDAGSSS